VGVFVKAAGTWTEIAASKAINWAVATGGTETTYTVGDINWKAHTFGANGTLTVSVAGQVEVMVISGGSGRENALMSSGGGGPVWEGIKTVTTGAKACDVGQGGGAANGPGNQGVPSSFDGFCPGQAGSYLGGPNGGGYGLAGYVSSISGTSVTYSLGGGATPGSTALNGVAGTVIVRYQV